MGNSNQLVAAVEELGPDSPGSVIADAQEAFNALCEEYDIAAADRPALWRWALGQAGVELPTGQASL
jgi:hypothetical protein